MSTQYKKPSEVPTDTLIMRVENLADAVTKGESGKDEFTMRIPAECDRDADIVLAEVAKRFKDLDAQLAKANERFKVLERETAQKKHHFVGYSNGFQIAYAKHDEGCFYPSTDGDSYIPLYMLDVHLHRLGGTASDEWAKKLRKEQDSE